MNTDDVITAFATAGNDLPREAMQWTLDNWEEALPTLLQRLDAYTDGTDRSDEASETLFYFLHLCAEKNEARAFPGLCRFLADAAAAEHVLADAKTMTLSGMLIGTFNGDTALLRQLIEDAGADDYVHGQTLGSMAYLTRSGRIADAEMRAYLLYLFDAMQPRGEHVVWWGWVDAAAALGYADLEEQAKILFERKFVSEGWTDLKFFHEDLAASEDEAMQAECFKRGSIAPLTDAIGELSGWYGFSAEAKLERERAAEPVIPAPVWGKPVKNPLRNVGRNDPCPCGSGKKYKKCCLVA